MIIHNVEQGSYEWHQLRTGKVTSTRLKRVLGSSNMDLIDELIAEIETGYMEDADAFVSEAMQRGTDLEPIAIKAYEELKGYKTEVVGFMQSEEYPLFGVSADRLVPDLKGAVEVKCPDTKKHIRHIRQNRVNADYEAQVISYFIVDPTIEWVDFVSFDPRLTRKPLHIIRVNRADYTKEIAEAQYALSKFFVKLKKTMDDLFF